MPRHPGNKLKEFALSLPEAWLDHPWGEDVAKVGKKVFVFFGVSERFGMSVKLPKSSHYATSMEGVEPTGYGLGKSGWVTVGRASMAKMPIAELREWILESYCAVAPKKLTKDLVL